MKKHIHKYSRVKMESGKVLFRCKKPGCTHYLLSQFIEGAEGECPGCESKFVINAQERYKKTPMCANCRGKKKKRDVEEIIPSSSVEELLKILGPK